MSSLVTGVHGLLGSTLVRTLPDTHGSGVDVRDAGALLSEAKELQPTVLIHTAALTNVGYCEQHPEEAFAVNAEGTRHAMEAARAVGARLIYISTVSVFPGDTGNYTESDTPHAINIYNESKLKGEEYALSYERATVLRLNIMGVHPNGSRGKNFIEWLIDSARTNKDVTLFTDARVNPLSNWTIASLIHRLVEEGIEERVLHLGSSDVRSKADVGKEVFAHFPDYQGVVSEGSIDAVNDGVIRPKEMWLNVDRAASLFGPLPTIAHELETIFSRQSI